MIKSRIRELWERYIFNAACHGVRHLSDIYGTWSNTKQIAWNQIAAECSSHNGFKLSVITYNGWQFTVGYMYKEGDKLIFRVHTPNDSGTMELGHNEKHDIVQHKVL